MVNRHQLDVIEYLREENRVLKERLGDRRIRFISSRSVNIAGITVEQVETQHQEGFDRGVGDQNALAGLGGSTRPPSWTRR